MAQNGEKGKHAKKGRGKAVTRRKKVFCGPVAYFMRNMGGVKRETDIFSGGISYEKLSIFTI